MVLRRQHRSHRRVLQQLVALRDDDALQPAPPPAYMPRRRQRGGGGLRAGDRLREGGVVRAAAHRRPVEPILAAGFGRIVASEEDAPTVLADLL